MFHLILYQPEIPPNTGNIIRLSANTGTRLHLIEPLGFDLDEKRLKRAGLDYRELADVRSYHTLDACLQAIGGPRTFALTTRARTSYASPRFARGDAFLFGPETRGLPAGILDALPEERRLRLPMLDTSRSLNLANSAAVMIYEAWRQHDFAGAR